MTYGDHRQCGRDASYPELTLVRYESDDDRRGFEVFGGPTGKSQVRWGRRTVVLQQSSYNAVTRFTSTSIVEVVDEQETPGQRFRMRACAGTFLGDDGRSFLDGKPFRCARQAVCAELDRRVAKDPKQRFDLVLRHADPVDEPLILMAVEDRTCDDPFDCWIDDECCRTGTHGECVPTGSCDGEVLGH